MFSFLPPYYSFFFWKCSATNTELSAVVMGYSLLTFPVLDRKNIGAQLLFPLRDLLVIKEKGFI